MQNSNNVTSMRVYVHSETAVSIPSRKYIIGVTTCTIIRVLYTCVQTPNLKTRESWNYHNYKASVTNFILIFNSSNNALQTWCGIKKWLQFPLKSNLIKIERTRRKSGICEPPRLFSIDETNYIVQPSLDDVYKGTEEVQKHDFSLVSKVPAARVHNWKHWAIQWPWQ